MGGKVCCFLYSKVCWQHPAMVCLYTFPAHNSNFHWRWRWWDWIQAIFLNLFYFTYVKDLGFFISWNPMYNRQRPQKIKKICARNDHVISLAAIKLCILMGKTRFFYIFYISNQLFVISTKKFGIARYKFIWSLISNYWQWNYQ